MVCEEMGGGRLEVLGRVEKVGSSCCGSGPESRLGTGEKGFRAAEGLRAASRNEACLARARWYRITSFKEPSSTLNTRF